MAALALPKKFRRVSGSELAMPTIQIKLERGTSQSVEGLTPAVAIEVFDYDIDKYESNQLSTDENGKTCEIREWHAPE
jgi:hypothetical protein